MALKLESSAFKDGDAIPHRYTCVGKDLLSPPLHWGVPPAATKSFAIIVVEDPDAAAGTWVHWARWTMSSTRKAASLPLQTVCARYHPQSEATRNEAPRVRSMEGHGLAEASIMADSVASGIPMVKV